MSAYYGRGRRRPPTTLKECEEAEARWAKIKQMVEDGKAMVARRNEIAALARELYVDGPGTPPRECFTLAEEFFAYQDEWFKEKKDSPHEGNG